MRLRLLVLLFVLASVVPPQHALAASHTLVYTNQQDNGIQNQLIPTYNRTKCAEYTLPPTCTALQLVAAGCKQVTVCTAANLTVGTPACTQWSMEFTESCTLFPSNAAGQDAWHKETTNRFMVAAFIELKRLQAVDYKAAFRAATPTEQQAACTAIGLPADCAGPD